MTVMEEKKTCPACGGALEYDSRCPLGSRELDLYLCPDCGRAELYEPEEERIRRRNEERETQDFFQSLRARLAAGEITVELFPCPTCGFPRRDRVCPVCGSVMDLGTMEELCPGDPEKM